VKAQDATWAGRKIRKWAYYIRGGGKNCLSFVEGGDQKKRPPDRRGRKRRKHRQKRVGEDDVSLFRMGGGSVLTMRKGGG